MFISSNTTTMWKRDCGHSVFSVRYSRHGEGLYRHLPTYSQGSNRAALHSLWEARKTQFNPKTWIQIFGSKPRRSSELSPQQVFLWRPAVYIYRPFCVDSVWVRNTFSRRQRPSYRGLVRCIRNILKTVTVLCLASMCQPARSSSQPSAALVYIYHTEGAHYW